MIIFTRKKEVWVYERCKRYINIEYNKNDVNFDKEYTPQKMLSESQENSYLKR